MTLDETWQQIDRLIQTKKYARAQAEQLRECLVSLLVTPEGREVLKLKLPASKHKKSKKLLAGLDEALDGPMPSWEATSPRERHDLLRALLEAIPPSETTHWNPIMDWSPTRLWIGVREAGPPIHVEPDYGLESAKPDLQSTFKKPGAGVIRRASRAVRVP